MKEYYLFAGDVFVPDEPYLVSTVLGSCVSVCLWDHVLRRGGINHYMHPRSNGRRQLPTRCGDVAIPALIDAMLKRGSRKRNLRASVFGGGKVIGVKYGEFDISDRNISIALEILGCHGVPIVISDTGGNFGRRLMYNTGEGTATLRKIRRLDHPAARPEPAGSAL